MWVFVVHVQLDMLLQVGARREAQSMDSTVWSKSGGIHNSGQDYRATIASITR
jgi:hypothetical protein